MNTLTETEAAYFAGLIDGDGRILAQIVERPDYILKHQLRVSILLIQSKKRMHFLKQFQKEIEAGTLRDRGDGIAELAIVGIHTVLPFLKQIQPFLRLKLKQANLVIQIIEQLPLTKNNAEKFLWLCQLADQVSELNDSKSQNKITATRVKQRFLDLGLITN